MKKITGFALAAVFALSAVAPAQAATVAELQAQIEALMAQLAATSGTGSTTSSASYNFTKDLTLGSTGADVVALQTALESKGALVIPAGTSKGYFGALTQQALAKYQAQVGISPASGYFGPMTRAHFNSTTGTTTPTTPTTPSNGLQGGAGSISDYELISSYNNEEVGEEEEDVVVAGLEIEADDSSDLAITAVRLVFTQGTAGSDFEDYASEVSIWFDGEEVGRVDADEFDDDNDFTKTVTLDEGAVVEADETGELLVAITGVNNLDSADAGDTWTVDFRQVRFEDAQGGLISEDPTTAVRTFSFDTFASSADVELKVAAGDDEINDAHVIDVDDNDDTDDVELLSFTLEAEGDSDIEVKELPINIDVTGATNVDDVITTVYLYADGEEIGSENIPTTAGADETVTFNDLDFVIDAGDEIEFIVKADFIETAGALDNGDTIAVQISGTEVDLIDAEDETGEELAAADLTGSAIGEAHAVYDAGIMVSNIVVETTNKTTSDATGIDEQVTFEFEFDVTAFDTDVFVDNGCVEDNDGTYTNGTGVNYITTNSADHSTGCTLTTSADAGTNGYEVEEGDTETFTLTVTATADTASDFVQVTLGMINWATTDIAGNQQYTFNLDDVKSQSIFINNRP